MGLILPSEVSTEAGRGSKRSELLPTFFTSSLAHHFLKEILPQSCQKEQVLCEASTSPRNPLLSLGYNSQWACLHHPQDRELLKDDLGSPSTQLSIVYPGLSTGQADLPREGGKESVCEGETSSDEDSEC